MSIKDTIYQRMKAGEYTREELTQDGLHPNDKGHKLVAEEIIKLLESVKAELDVEEEETIFPEAMTENAYENAKQKKKPDILIILKMGGLEKKPEIQFVLK